MKPTRRMGWGIAIWAAVGLTISIIGLPQVGVLAWAGTGGLLLLAVIYDLVVAIQTPPPEVERTPPRSLALGAESDVVLKLTNVAQRRLKIDVFDHYPVDHSQLIEGLPRQIVLDPSRGEESESWTEFKYSLLPIKRGLALFGRAELLIDGPLGLIQWRTRLGEPQERRVYPNFREVSRYALLALADRLGSMGIRQLRRRGQGLDFKQLRDYRDGDLLRQIDWKATARRQRLISREYQDERNQQVVFLIDCGRRMRAREGEITHFDHVLNSILLLSTVALRQEDSIGFLTFSNTGRPRWLPPQRGRGAMHLILQQVYDLETSTAPSDFAEAARRLLVHQRRRALVILVTNLREEDSGELRHALATLRRRHLVVLASLQEEVLKEVTDGAIEGFESALQLAEAHRHLAARRIVHEAARQQGTIVLDVPPRELPVALVNRYLQIKGSGQL